MSPERIPTVADEDTKRRPRQVGPVAFCEQTRREIARLAAKIPPEFEPRTASAPPWTGSRSRSLGAAIHGRCQAEPRPCSRKSCPGSATLRPAPDGFSTSPLAEVTRGAGKLCQGQMLTVNLPATCALRPRSSRTESRDPIGSDRFAPSAQGFKTWRDPVPPPSLPVSGPART